MFHVVKRIIGAVILLGFTLILIGQVPALPSSKPIFHGNYGAEVRKYVFENIFAIVGFIVSLLIGFRHLDSYRFRNIGSIYY